MRQPENMILASAAPNERTLEAMQLTVPVEFEAAAASGGAGEGGQPRPRRFKMRAYNGGVMRVVGFWRPVVVDLTGMQQANGVKAYLDHDVTRRVGHIDRIDVGKSHLNVEGVVSSTSEAAREVMADADNGYPWQASIGASILSLEDVSEGQSVQVNGKTFRGPVLVARQSRLVEVSFVGNGADDKTSASIAAGAAQEVMTMTFEQWLEKKGWKEAGLSAEQKTALKAAYQADLAAGAGGSGGNQPPADNSPAPSHNTSNQQMQASAPQGGQSGGGQSPQASASQGGHGGGGQPAASESEIIARERQRVAEIEAACSAVPMSEEVGRLRASALEGGMEVSDLRAKLLDIVRASRPQAPAVGRGYGPATPQVLSAVMVMQAGGLNDQQLLAAYGEQTLDQANKLRRLSLQGIIRACAESEGQQISALAGERDLVAAGFSTVSLPGVLSDSANKTLLGAYAAVPSVAVRVSKKLTANDFKTHTGYRISGDWKLKPLGPDGELKHASFGEKGYPYRVSTKGRFWGLTREMIRNDDIGAFLEFFQGFGRGYALTREEDFWKMVLANADNFFHANNSNYVTGANTVLSIAGLDTVTMTLRKQTDENGNALMLQGWGLVVPPELEATADSIYRSLTVNTGGSSTKDKVENANRYSGKYEPMVVPHLSNASYPGNSALAYYLFANPADVPAFGIAYLDGVETPVMEEVSALPQFLGQCWRVYGDYGVCALDPRGVVKSKGGA